MVKKKEKRKIVQVKGTNHIELEAVKKALIKKGVITENDIEHERN